MEQDSLLLPAANNLAKAEAAAFFPKATKSRNVMWAATRCEEEAPSSKYSSIL